MAGESRLLVNLEPNAGSRILVWKQVPGYARVSGSSVKLAGGPRGAGRLRTGRASSVPAGRPAESATPNLTQRLVGSRDCVLPPAPTRHVHSVHTRDICSIFAGAGHGARAVATLWPEATDRREALPLSEPTKQVESVLPETRTGRCHGCDDSRAKLSYCSSCCRQATELRDGFMRTDWSVVVFPGLLCSCENGRRGGFKVTC